MKTPHILWYGAALVVVAIGAIALGAPSSTVLLSLVLPRLSSNDDVHDGRRTPPWRIRYRPHRYPSQTWPSRYARAPLTPPRGELPDAASRIVRVMGSHHGDRPDNRRALLWTASLIAVGAAVVAIAVATGALRLGKSADPAPTAEQLAQQRCQSEVLKRVGLPDNATISELRAEPSTLDVDGRDFSSLTASEPLKGIDTSRISVLNVSVSPTRPARSAPRSPTSSTAAPTSSTARWPTPGRLRPRPLTTLEIRRDEPQVSGRSVKGHCGNFAPG